MSGLGGEAARKGIHVLVSLCAAIVVWRLPSEVAAVILAAATAAALGIEVLRLAAPKLGAAFIARLGPMLRARETRRLTGATTLALGYTVTAVVLPGPAALAGILFVGVGDATAAVVGRRWGRHRYPGGKSVEGSAAFFGIALLISLAVGAAGATAAVSAGADLGLLAALVIAGIVTLVEALSLPVDDNLYLPVVGAAVFRTVAGF